MRPLAALAAAVLLVGGTMPAEACVGLTPPVDGPVVAGFAPRGRWSGHWGIDIGTGEETPVHAAGAGVVRFAGSVAGMRSVTVDHGGGLLSTVSWLSAVGVGPGRVVGSWSVLGWSGEHDGRAAVHVSTRIDGRYVDPAGVFGCAAASPVGAVRLVPLP
jgi:murein DD-endopeptidase MepM/ murein hydrolase activator NlpD